MKIYIIWLISGLTIIGGINAVLLPAAAGAGVTYIVLAVLINFFIIFAWDCLVAFIVHKLPHTWFNPYKKVFKIFKFEKRFYEFIGIKKWKSKIPELGQLCNFKKDKLEKTEEEYLFKFLEETCYAGALHVAMAILGFAVMFINPVKLWIYYPLQLCIFNFILHIPPLCVQRYNRPKLVKIYERKVRLLNKNNIVADYNENLKKSA